MSNALDQSLDDIISSKPRNRRIRKSRRGGLRVNKAAETVNPRNAPTQQRTRQPAAQPAQENPLNLFDQGSKIVVSNLPTDVTEQQIKELFNVQIGKVKTVQLTYGPNGNSRGIATIVFSQKGDAKKAYDRYEGKLIDNTRRLKVEIIMDPKSTKPNLAARIQQTPVVSVAVPRAQKSAARGARGGRGAARGGRKPVGGRTGPSGSGRRPKKTVEELDEEMTDYFQGDAGNAA